MVAKIPLEFDLAKSVGQQAYKINIYESYMHDMFWQINIEHLNC